MLTHRRRDRFCSGMLAQRNADRYAKLLAALPG